MTLDTLISKLEALRSQWATIAQESGISYMTIKRIVARKNSPAWDTMQALDSACNKIKRRKQ